MISYYTLLVVAGGCWGLFFASNLIESFIGGFVIGLTMSLVMRKWMCENLW